MGRPSEQDVVDALKEANDHWSYVSGILTHAGRISERELQSIGYHYRTAFIHGWKHAIEASE